ncbi:MAG: TetR/AcrR family transcriptional regulator [Candidatus Eremiobacterota bacterium]
MADFTIRQKEIIEVSIELISKGGIQELTIKHISREMGISEPAIYRHFESKLDILLAILTYFEDLTIYVSEKAFSMKNPVFDRIETFFSGLMDEFRKNPSLTKVIFSEEIFQNDRRLSEKVLSVMKGHQRKIFESVGEGQVNGQIRNDIPQKHVVMFIMGTFRLLVTRWRLSGFNFDLKQEGKELFSSMKKLIVKE